MAYAGVKQPAVAEALHISIPTVGRIMNGSRKETNREELWQIIELCGVPRDWLAADLSRLSEIAAEGQPSFGDSTVLRQQMTQELDALVQQAQKRDSAGEAERRRIDLRQAADTEGPLVAVGDEPPRCSTRDILVTARDDLHQRLLLIHLPDLRLRAAPSPPLAPRRRPGQPAAGCRTAEPIDSRTESRDHTRID